jgi:acyl-ACP thioesterase
VRATDIDLLGHVNNAATWAVVEEVLAQRPLSAPWRAELEYRTPIGPAAEVVIDHAAHATGADLWMRDAGASTLLATARLRPLPG